MRDNIPRYIKVYLKKYGIYNLANHEIKSGIRAETGKKIWKVRNEKVTETDYIFFVFHIFRAVLFWNYMNREWGSRGRWFKSSHSDQRKELVSYKIRALLLLFAQKTAEKVKKKKGRKKGKNEEKRMKKNSRARFVQGRHALHRSYSRIKIISARNAMKRI